MGEAKQKRRLLEREWVALFPDGRPGKAAISRPSARTSTTRPLETGFADDIARRLASREPALCFNFECSNEIQTMPEVFAFLQTTEDKRIPAIGMGICAKCAAKSDDEIRAIMRKLLGSRFGLGLDGKNSKHTTFQTELEAAHWIDLGRIKIVVVKTHRLPNDPMCDVARTFAALVQTGKLSRFSVFYFGAHNCHALVDQIYFDLQDINATHLFEFKRGSSRKLRSEADPDGLHSWIEADGWAIDVSGGALGNPVMIQPIEDFYARYDLVDIRNTMH